MTPDHPAPRVARLRCAVCRRRVRLVETPGHACLVDDETAAPPHRCPDDAVDGYLRLRREAARALATRFGGGGRSR